MEEEGAREEAGGGGRMGEGGRREDVFLCLESVGEGHSHDHEDAEVSLEEDRHGPHGNSLAEEEAVE